MDTLAADNPRAVMGGNAPPLTPYEAAEKAIEDIYSEASLWLDGAVVSDKATADGIDNLKKEIVKVRKAADEARKIENKPFDEGKAEVQARYNPLLAKADLAKDACNEALKPWLIAEGKRLDAEAAEARRIADEKRIAAEEAIRGTDATNLAAREAAEALVKDSKKADAAANRAGRQTATAGGSFGRATGLRSYTVATITDLREAARHYWTAAPDDMRALIQGLADKDAAAGKRDIPGITVTIEQRAV